MNPRRPEYEEGILKDYAITWGRQGVLLSRSVWYDFRLKGQIDTHLTFTGPCIVIYSYNESQRDALFLIFIW